MLGSACAGGDCGLCTVNMCAHNCHTITEQQLDRAAQLLLDMVIEAEEYSGWDQASTYSLSCMGAIILMYPYMAQWEAGETVEMTRDERLLMSNLGDRSGEGDWMRYPFQPYRPTSRSRARDSMAQWLSDNALEYGQVARFYNLGMFKQVRRDR